LGIRLENFMENFQMSKRLRLFNRGTVKISLCLVSSLLMMSACAKSAPPGTNENSASSSSIATQTSTTTSVQQQQQGVAATPSASLQPGENVLPNGPDSKAGPPPTLAEAQSSVARIYKNAVTVDTGYSTTPFVVGDFNDDGSQDIAVVVRPAKGMLPTLNGEYANWILEDVSQVELPVVRNGVQVLPPKPGPVKIEGEDPLLVIIHGYKQEGWRNGMAQQTYLLKNGVGENMRTQQVKYALSGASGNNPHVGRNGDVIKETRAKTDGFIFWTGAKYAWRP
jgi:hypothetical protein